MPLVWMSCLHGKWFMDWTISPGSLPSPSPFFPPSFLSVFFFWGGEAGGSTWLRKAENLHCGKVQPLAFLFLPYVVMMSVRSSCDLAQSDSISPACTARIRVLQKEPQQPISCDGTAEGAVSPCLQRPLTEEALQGLGM